MKAVLFSFSFVLLLVTFGFSQTKGLSVFELAGTYQWDGDGLELAAKIQLNADSTFIYWWQVGLMGGQTDGFWRVEQDNIVLNSVKQPSNKSSANNVEVMNQCTSPNTVIKVRDGNGTAMPFATCKIVAGNHLYSSVTDSNGIAEFQVRSVRKISISYVGYKTITFTSREKSDNWFAFTMQTIDEPYHYFTNEKWAIRNGRLYDYSIKTNHYVKNNFYHPVVTQSCVKCDIENVKTVVKNIDNLSFNLVAQFLCSFDGTCVNNAEYSEFANEILYDVLTASPATFFQVLEIKEVNIQHLLRQIENPVNDGIDLQKAYYSVKATSARKSIKTQFLNSIILAASKGGQTISK